jgi:hypothetical protein
MFRISYFQTRYTGMMISVLQFLWSVGGNTHSSCFFLMLDFRMIICDLGKASFNYLSSDSFHFE